MTIELRSELVTIPKPFILIPIYIVVKNQMENRITPVTQTGRAFKYQFDLEIQRTHLQIPFPCMVQVSWRRGNKSIQTKNKIDLQGHQKYFDVGQKMSMISTCYLDDTTHRFSEKNSMLNIIIFINSVPKSGGCCPLDLSQVLNPFNHKECMPRNLQLPLVKCPIKNSRICLVLSATYLQEMVQDDNRSIGSGISSALNYSDSNFSVSFNRRTFEPPSKDTASVHLEGSAPRFPSSSRRNDQNGVSVKESIAKKKADIVGQISFGAPLVSIAENIGYESEKSISMTQKVQQCYQLQGNRDKGFSINSATPSSTSPPKTNNPCSNSNKVSRDQKLKQQKFKLQTENTQLKMFVQEQSRRLNDYLSQCSTLKQELRSKDVNIERQGQHLSNITRQLKMLQQELERQRQAVSCEQSKSSSKVVDLQKQISIQMKEVQIKIAERQELNMQFGQLKNEYEGLRNAYERIKGQCQKQKQNSTFLRGQIENGKITLEQVKRQTDDQISMMNSKVFEREAHIEHLRKEILSVKEARQQDQLTLTAINQKANILQNKCRQLEKILGSNSEKLRFKQRQTEQKDNIVAMLGQKLDEQKRMRDEAVKKCEQAKSRAEQWKQKMEQAKLKMEEAERKVQQINIQLQWRDTQLRNLEHVHDQLQARTNQLTYESSKTFDESQKRITELLLQVGSLQRQLSCHVNSKTQSQTLATVKIQELEQRIIFISEESERKVWNINKDFEVIERDLRTNCEELKKQLEASQHQFQAKLAEASQSSGDIGRRLSMKQGQVGSLQKINNDLRNEISQLSAELASSKQQFTRLLDINRKNSTVLRDFELLRSDLQKTNIQINRLRDILNQKDHELNRREKQAQDAKSKSRVLCQQMQQLIIQNEQQTKKIKYLEEEQIQSHQNTISRLKTDMSRIQQQLEQQRAAEVCQQDANSSQMTTLMKQNIQLQISLKVKEEQAKKCQQYSQEVVAYRNKLEFECANNKELEQQLAVIQKQLKEKTRASIIESEKARMFLDERDSYAVLYNQKSTALEIEKDKTQVLQRNLKEIQQRYDDAVAKIRQLQSAVRTVTSDMSRRADRSDEIRTYERRIKELEARDAEKIQTIEQLTRNLYKSNDSIKDLHRCIQQRTKQLLNKDRIISQLEHKLSSVDETKRRNSEAVLATNQRKNLQRKNELLLSQLCILRQRIDEQSRAPCDGELVQKVATLENQLLRKEEKLKRLEKENSKLQEENIQLNIRIMKELTEIQKKQEGIKSEYSKSLNKVLSDSHT